MPPLPSHDSETSTRAIKREGCMEPSSPILEHYLSHSQSFYRVSFAISRASG